MATSTPNPNPKLNSTFQRTVSLYDWWLIKSETDFNGKRLAVAGSTSNGKVVSRVFSSAPISKRYNLLELETADGVTVFIRGYINQTRSHDNGISSEVCSHFLVGFPYNWEDYSYEIPPPSDVDRENISNGDNAVTVPSNASKNNPKNPSTKPSTNDSLNDIDASCVTPSEKKTITSEEKSRRVLSPLERVKYLSNRVNNMCSSEKNGSENAVMSSLKRLSINDVCSPAETRRSKRLKNVKVTSHGEEDEREEESDSLSRATIKPLKQKTKSKTRSRRR